MKDRAKPKKSLKFNSAANTTTISPRYADQYLTEEEAKKLKTKKIRRKQAEDAAIPLEKLPTSPLTQQQELEHFIDNFANYAVEAHLVMKLMPETRKFDTYKRKFDRAQNARLIDAANEEELTLEHGKELTKKGVVIDGLEPHEQLIQLKRDFGRDPNGELQEDEWNEFKRFYKEIRVNLAEHLPDYKVKKIELVDQKKELLKDGGKVALIDICTHNLNKEFARISDGNKEAIRPYYEAIKGKMAQYVETIGQAANPQIDEIIIKTETKYPILSKEDFDSQNNRHTTFGYSMYVQKTEILIDKSIHNEFNKKFSREKMKKFFLRLVAKDIFKDKEMQRGIVEAAKIAGTKVVISNIGGVGMHLDKVELKNIVGDEGKAEEIHKTIISQRTRIDHMIRVLRGTADTLSKAETEGALDHIVRGKDLTQSLQEAKAKNAARGR